MSIKNLSRWNNVGGAGGNGSAYFGIGARMLNNAAKGLEGAATKHEQEVEKLQQKHITESTAKLAELGRKNGGKISQEDYDKYGAYDPKLLDNMLGNAADRRFREKKLADDNAYRAGALRGYDKIAAELKARMKLAQFKNENGYGYGSKKNGSGKYNNFLNNYGIVNDPFDSSKSTADNQNMQRYNTFLDQASAAGIPFQAVKAAVGQNAWTGGFWSEVGPGDEAGFDIEGAVESLRTNNFNI